MDGGGRDWPSPRSASPVETDAKSNRAFVQARRLSLAAVMFCYLFYYTGRQTFGFAIPGIHAELGLTTQTLGWVSAAMLWAYACGQIVNGNLGDRFGARRMMFAGALASFFLNWLTSCGMGFTSLAAAWSANGFAQSMGWAPGSRLVANWFNREERGRAFGLYVLAAGLSSVLAYVTSLVVIDVWRLDWRWIFRLPVALMLVGGIIVWLVARDRPADCGFPDLPGDSDAASRDSASRDGARLDAPVTIAETSWQRYRAAFTNGRLLIAGLAIGFQNTVRYALLIWVPVYFLAEGAARQSRSQWISVALPVGMTLGAVTSGWMSDRLFNARRSGIIASFNASPARRLLPSRGSRPRGRGRRGARAGWHFGAAARRPLRVGRHGPSADAARTHG